MASVVSVTMLALSLVITLSSVQASTNGETGSNRFAGQDRFQTAKAIGEAYTNLKCTNVILAYGNDFPDALSASILSKKMDAPILLVDKTTDDSGEAFDYIATHLETNGTVYIIGGTGVIGNDFERKLISDGYKNIKRLGGYDRYDTDMLIVNEVNIPTGTPVFIASGENFPDALCVSSFSGANQFPTLLVGANYFPDKTKSYIESTKPSTVYIAGGTGVVSQSIENQIKSIVPTTVVKRLAGNDRFETTGAILNELSPSPETVYLANGYSFPDALAGSGLAAKTGSPIILTDNTRTLPPSIESYLKKLQSAGIRPNVRALGGAVVVPDILIQQAENVLDGKPPIVRPNIVGGANGAYFLDQSGQVWLWGNNAAYTPVQVSNLSNIVAIAGGEYTGYALDNDGHVWAYGLGKYGSLGNDTGGTSDHPIIQTVPVQVSNISNVVAITAGIGTGYALDNTGHVWAWGDGVKGQLGNPELVSNKPIQVSNLANIVAIASKYYTTYALDKSGHVWSWGYGLDGQLGNGTTGTDTSFFGQNNDESITPVQVSDLSNIVSIAAGYSNGYALDNSGNVWVCGRGTFGELGDGTFIDGKDIKRVPIDKDGTLTPFRDFRADFYVSGNADGTLRNYGTTKLHKVPNFTNITRIAAGNGFSYALDASGHVWSWGYGESGTLGNGVKNISKRSDGTWKLDNSSIPVQVSKISNIVAIAAGEENGYALDASDQIWAWGKASGGRLGNGVMSGGTNGIQATPVKVSDITSN